MSLEKSAALTSAVGGGTIPTPSAEPETTTDGLVLERGGDEIPICLLGTERIVTKSGEVVSAEEGATVLDNLGSETEEKGTLGLPLIIINDSTQSELQN